VPNCAQIDPDACLRLNGSRPDCEACASACPMGAVAFEQVAQHDELAAGGIVVATGASIYDPSALRELGYEALPDVYTAAEVERLVSSNGPTGGKLLKRDGTEPERIAILHCVGRRQLGYCSGICCQTSLKLAILAQHKLACEVVVLHTDLVLPGQQAEALRRQAQSARFVRVVDAAATRVEACGERMRIHYMTHFDRNASMDVDLVVLVTGLMPSAGTKQIARQIGLETNAAGFIATDHAVLRPARASLRGVYVAGCASGPQGIGASVAQAGAASGSLLSELRPGELLRTSDRIADIEDELCSACKFCVTACPYSATSVGTTGEVVLNSVLCLGCGTCVAACPSGAARARHFRDDQLLAELSEVLRD
jgi:heterodisulfide reductase subunit A